VRIFLTGATGFIGGHFVTRATPEHQVIGLVRRPNDLSRLTRSPNLEVRVGDLLDRTSLLPALADADCVCHFAGAFRESGVDEAYFHRVNVEGTANLVSAAHAAGVRRLVHCSTAGIYGRRVPGRIDENHPTHPWNAYERSKLDAEEVVRSRAREYGMEYVILRPSSVYGPGDPRLAKLFRNAARGRFPLFGSGAGRRHLVHVDDLVDACLRACTLPQAANQELIIAGPEAVPLKELLETLAALSDRKSYGPRLPLLPMLALAAVTEDVCSVLKIEPPLYRRRMDFYTSDTEFDCARARAVLGWEPSVHLRQGLEATLRAERTLRPTRRATALMMILPAGTMEIIDGGLAYVQML
jgi:nucleoside-diphosphate-sugar epimerase